MASVFKRNDKGKYLASWTDHLGQRKVRSTKTTDRAAAERIAAKYEADAALRRDGVIDPREDRYSAAARQPIADWLQKFKIDLQSRDNTDRHCLETHKHTQFVAEKAKAQTIADLTADEVKKAIGEIRKKGPKGRPVGLKTANHYLRAIKMFTRWLHREARALRDDPLVAMKLFNAETDQRHKRREFTLEEFDWLLQVTHSRTLPDHTISGPDRAMCYRVAAGTGFRAKELRSLTIKSFSLDAGIVSLKAQDSKNRKAVDQPIHRTLIEVLRPWLKEKSRASGGRPVFDGMPAKTARTLKGDLKAARQAWIAAAGEGKEEKARRHNSDFLKYRDSEGDVIDFHALRHTYVSAVCNGGQRRKLLGEYK